MSKLAGIPAALAISLILVTPAFADGTADPPTATIATPPDGAVYALGQVVDADYSCSEGAGGPGIASCTDRQGVGNGNPIDTSSVGPYTFSVTAVSEDGQRSKAVSHYKVVGPPTITITTPVDGATYEQGQRVRAQYKCTDAPGAPGIASCTDSQGVGTNNPIDTADTGSHSFTVTATSSDGLVTTMTVNYDVSATISGLRGLVASYNLPAKTAGDLNKNLDDAQNQLLANKTANFCKAMGSFVTRAIGDALTDKPTLTTSQATKLVDEANEIQADNGCTTPTPAQADAEHALLALGNTLTGFALPGNVVKDLIKPLGDAGGKLAQGKSSDACKSLTQFEQKVSQDQSQGKLTSDQAAQLTTEPGGSNSIRSGLGC